MTIRFLQTSPSGNDEYPFQPGQVIHVEHPSPELLALIDGVHAEAVRDEGMPELATVRAPRKGRAAARGRR
jgi:hypothetical protein